MQGSGPKDKQIKYADRQSLIPWRPRIGHTESNLTKIVVGIYAAVLIYQLVIVAKAEPQMFGLVGACLNIYKQFQMRPPGGTQNSQSKFDGQMRCLTRCAASCFALISFVPFGRAAGATRRRAFARCA